MMELPKPSSDKKSTIKAGMVIILGPLLVLGFVLLIHHKAAEHKQQTAVTMQPTGILSPTEIIAHCIVSASITYQVPTDAILGIVSVEGGHVGQAVGPNQNGTYDLGLMQINSLWVPQLARLWQIDDQTAYNALRDSGCENIYVGTWILKQKIVETGSLYNGIAYYHSATRVPGTVYADKVMAVMRQNIYAAR